MNQTRFGFLFAALFLCFVSSVYATTKEEVLPKYEQVIIKSNEMGMYGYDLTNVTHKLKKMTDTLLQGQYSEADRMIGEIKKDLQLIEAKGPEQLRKERELVWLEIFGDFIQQFALFLVLTFFLLRFAFVRRSMMADVPSYADRYRLAVAFIFASFFGASLALIRYDESAWSFVDLQVSFIGIAGLIGGIWVGLIVGLANSLMRLLIVPGITIYFILPATIGIVAGILHRFLYSRPLKHTHIFLAGFVISLIHSFFMYLPVYQYLTPIVFTATLLCLALAEGSMIWIYFMFANQIFKEEKRKQTERELFQTQLKFLHAQINPHFLFNALNTIASICGDEGAKKARQLVVELSTFFRRITKRESDFVPLSEEFEYIDAYLNIEQARFGERLKVEKNIQLSPASLNTLVPILVLQPMVENAVKHGLSKKAEGGSVILEAEELDGHIKMKIRDTGVGMDSQTLEQLLQGSYTHSSSQHSGIAFKNVRERLLRVYGDQSQLTIESVVGEGTNITVTFPKDYDPNHYR